MSEVTIEDLRKVVALQDLPNEHLQWLLDHSDYREYADGEIIAKYGDPAEVMWMSWEGRITFYMYVNGRQIHYFTFENSPVTGGVGGLLPYSRMKNYPGNSFAVGEVKAIRLNKKYFQELEALNPDLIQRLIGYMTERARAFATTQLQHEKVNALGNLAAGVAHELNNPAAAIRGIAGELHERLNRNYQLTKDLLQCNISPDQIQAIHELVEKKQTATIGVRISALKKIEKQDEMEDWLIEQGISKREIAETFVDAGFSIEELESIKGNLGNQPFAQAMPWLENLVSSQKIIKDLGDASSHISRLVASIKSHVHMDRPDDIQMTNVHEGIESTITLLGFKLREKNIELVRKFAEDMPQVPAYVGELNQVWSNLIDNAIFAVPKGGTIIIETVYDTKNVTVCVIDNGEGIPKDIQTKIFDPFFTTKKVGEGTGIGLDIVLRIIKRHEGEIKLDSAPGRTQFSICLPRTQKSA